MGNDQNAIEKALLVMVLDGKIRSYLAKNDPKALQQAVRALDSQGCLEREAVHQLVEEIF